MGWQTQYHDDTMAPDESVPLWAEITHVVTEKNASTISVSLYRSKEALEAGRSPAVPPVAHRVIDTQEVVQNIVVQDDDGTGQPVVERRVTTPATKHHTELLSQKALSEEGNHPFKAAEVYMKKHAPWLPKDK